MSLILGYDDERNVSDITFEGLKINGRTIYDDMPDKPKWYKTADMARMYVNDHVHNLIFRRYQSSSTRVSTRATRAGR